MTSLIICVLILVTYHFLILEPKIDALHRELTDRNNQNLFSNFEQLDKIKKSLETDIIKLSSYIEEHNRTGKEIINTIEKHFNDNKK